MKASPQVLSHSWEFKECLALPRYVTRERVQAMLDYEYLQCNLTLRKQRGNNTAFFAFSDTVVAKAFNRDNECHGWLGIKYQSGPRCRS